MELITRKKAMKNGLTRYFTGIPCGKGHLSERYTSCGKCAECGRLRNLNNAEYHKEYLNKWAAEHKGYFSTSEREKRKLKK